jgi:hypothetical protein
MHYTMHLDQAHPSTPSVFLSYSHRDETWKDRLKTHLIVLEQMGLLVVWDDRRIDEGQTWFDELRAAMDRADVAVCLISANYLASDFCNKEEIPYLLRRRAEEGMVLIPLLLSPCPWKAVPWLRSLQMTPADARSVAEFSPVEQDAIFSRVAETILQHVHRPQEEPDAPKPSSSTSQSTVGPRGAIDCRVEIDRLPFTGRELFGRQDELDLLDHLWSQGSIQVAALVAWGGVGKSTLVNRWLQSLRDDGWRGARRVYGWSFYSQGTGDRVTSADDFIHDALQWFGDPEPAAGSSWAKGERLAERVRSDRTLLILDGIEPLQSSGQGGRGAIGDSALAALLGELARPAADPWGLCLITSREPLVDLRDFKGSFAQKDLEQISPAAGRALLRVGGIRGTDAELEAASLTLGNYALAVKLLAAYLKGVAGHGVHAAREVPELHLADEKGRHPRRVMEAFARRFGSGPELELLELLGLFDRPAPSTAIDAIRAVPVIPGLTDHLAYLDGAGWSRLLQTLRRCELVAEGDPHAPDEIDAHPLVREHFAERLKARSLYAWQEAHARLSAYYRQVAPDLPQTIGEMAPLYPALAHACKAGLYQYALDEIYRRRILRGGAGFSVYILGTMEADLAALASFFPAGWNHPEPSLSRTDQIFLLERAGLYMRSLGRREAGEVLHAGKELALAFREYLLVEKCTRHLAAVYRTAGELQASLEQVGEAIGWADKCSDTFYRVANRASRAQLLHYFGQGELALATFQDAEARIARSDPGFPWLFSYPGFHYCELLLDLGRHDEVVERAERTLALSFRRYPLQDEARDHLSRGGGLIGLARTLGQKSLLPQAAAEVELAVEGLQKAGMRYLLLDAFLLRAELQRLEGAFGRAQTDLDKVLFAAKQFGMRLHETDGHLESARLLLAVGDRRKVRQHLERARQLIAETGYHRRDRDVADLERGL